MLAATAGIHLDLYLTGYRSIPTIGWLFLLQVISAFALAVANLALWPQALSRLAAAGGALFALSTLGGYLLSIWVGLFGFREVRTTAGIVAGVIEVAAFAALAPVALAGLRRPAGLAAAGKLASPGTALVSVAALALLAAAVAGASAGPSAPASGRTTLHAARIDGQNALTDARGFTLYQFARDVPGKSNCYGACAAYWPPVTGTPVAGAGVTGKLGTTPRSGGPIQATYNGHPLYTYVGDASPGQAAGNNLNLNGGIWHIVPIR